MVKEGEAVNLTVKLLKNGKEVNIENMNLYDVPIDGKGTMAKITLSDASFSYPTKGKDKLRRLIFADPSSGLASIAYVDLLAVEQYAELLVK